MTLRLAAWERGRPARRDGNEGDRWVTYFSLPLSRFYHLWRHEPLEPAEALRRVQIWLRDSTPEQRMAFFREAEAAGRN